MLRKYSQITDQSQYCLTFQKILERLVFNRCTEFIENNNILNAKQFGFTAHHSTSMAIMQVVDKINDAVEKKKRNDNWGLFIFIKGF